MLCSAGASQRQAGGKGRIITHMAHSLGIGVGGCKHTAKSFQYNPTFPLKQPERNRHYPLALVCLSEMERADCCSQNFRLNQRSNKRKWGALRLFIFTYPHSTSPRVACLGPVCPRAQFRYLVVSGVEL